MKNIIILLTISFAIISCGNSKESQLEKITAMEKSEKVGTTEGLAELAKMHKEYGLKYEDPTANNYLYAAAQYYYYENKNDEASKLLTKYIERDDSTERFKNAAINLALLKGKATEFDVADDLISEVLEKELPTAAQWQDIAKMYQDKVKDYNDVKPSDYERLALAYTATGRFSQATASLDSAVSKYPDYSDRANLIYRAGFISWEYLKDTKIARKYYSDFLSEYPNDPKAGEVKEILNSGMLEMSDEAILEMLKGKNNG